MTLIDQLALVARAYVDATDLKVSRVSTLVFGDGGKLAKIMEGSAGITTWRFEETMQWFSNNWPEGHDWPRDAMRPARVTRPDPSAPSTQPDSDDVAPAEPAEPTS